MRRRQRERDNKLKAKLTRATPGISASIYIYIYIYRCVRACACVKSALFRTLFPHPDQFRYPSITLQ